MKIRLAQNTPAMDNATPGTMNGTMPNAMSGGMTTESRMNMMGLGPMIASPNLNAPVEQFGATQASMMRASGGPIPGLREAKPTTSAQGITNDIAILNSALVLEHLEAEFYARVVAADQARSFLQGRQRNAAVTLARDEAAHVLNVSEMIVKLGGAPIEKPPFQFPANVFLSPIAFLQLAVELEENGVGAYLGAAPMVANKDVLNFAASIYGIEARHTGLIRFLLGDQIAPRPLEQPRTIEEAVANAAPFIVKDIVMPAGTG